MQQSHATIICSTHTQQSYAAVMCNGVMSFAVGATSEHSRTFGHTGAYNVCTRLPDA